MQNMQIDHHRTFYISFNIVEAVDTRNINMPVDVQELDLRHYLAWKHMLW